jgi:hypothetical protein
MEDKLPSSKAAFDAVRNSLEASSGIIADFVGKYNSMSLCLAFELTLP